MSVKNNITHDNVNGISGKSEEQGTPTPIIRNDEIDLIALAKTIWNGRETIYKSVGIAILLGLIIAFVSPKKYTATATLLPSAEKKSSNLGGLSALAGMAGINLNSMFGETSGIPANLYPQVVNSFPFQNELIHQKFNFSEFDHPVSIYDYVVADSIESVGRIILKYTVKLPWTLKKALFPPKNKVAKNKYGVIYLTDDEVEALEYLDGLIQVDVDDETGLVTLSAEGKEPVATAQFIKKAVDLLQEYVINYKTGQVRENLKFVKESFEEKKKEYGRIQKEFFEYKDRHRNIDPNRIDVRFQQLSDEYDIITTVYKGLAQQLEQAKVSVKEQTPVFTVLEPAIVPDKKSSPRRTLIIIFSVFIGGILGIGVIFWKIFRNRIESKWNGDDKP